MIVWVLSDCESTTASFLVMFVSVLLSVVSHFPIFWPAAVSGSPVPEWAEFVVVWLPTSNGFLNCIFYFWINRNFRRKFRLVLQRLALALCPGLANTFGWSNNPNTQFVSGVWDINVHERSSSVSSTCTLVSMAWNFCSHETLNERGL